MTDQILSSFNPVGTASDKELDRALTSLTSCLMVSRVHISGTEYREEGDCMYSCYGVSCAMVGVEATGAFE